MGHVMYHYHPISVLDKATCCTMNLPSYLRDIFATTKQVDFAKYEERFIYLTVLRLCSRKLRYI